MTFPALKDVEGKLSAKQSELAGIFAEAGPELDMSKVKSLGDSADVVDHIRNLNTELDELGRKADELREIGKAADRAKKFESDEVAEAGADEVQSKGRKSFGDMFVASDAYKLKAGNIGPESHFDVDLKTLMTTSAGWDPEETRSGLVVLDAQRPVQVTDLVPSITINQTSYVYMEETTFTNSAAETAEGGAYGEAALALTEQTSPVRKIAVFLPVTDEQLEDEAGASGYINARLPFMIRQRLDSQILVGSGLAPNLTGVNNVTGIQTYALTSEPVFDAIHKGITKVKVTGRANPNAVVIHPNDWQAVRLTRTADGIYILGNPVDAGPSRLWGVTVVESDAQTENTAVVGDFANYSLLAVKRGIDVQVSNSHGTYFTEGKQAVRADMRAALAFTRPAAFCTVTGI